MFKNKKGYVLSELIIYLGLLCILLLVSNSFRLIKESNYKIRVQEEIKKVHNFLIEAKQLSKIDNLSGEIIFDRGEDRIIYRNIKRSKSLRLEEINLSNNMKNIIDITESGMINKSGTITIRDKNRKKIKEITITTGLKKINIR